MMQLKQITNKNIYRARKPTFYPIYVQSLKDGMKGFSFCHNLWSKAATLEDRGKDLLAYRAQIRILQCDADPDFCVLDDLE